MATAIKFPTTNTVVTTGWTNPTYVYADDTSYATATPGGKNISVVSSFGNFGFGAAIPAGSSIDSVTVEIGWFVSTTASVATLTAQAYVGTTAQGTAFNNTAEPTAITVQTFTVAGLTLTNLADGTFTIRVTATRGNSNTAFTGSLDYVKVTVGYTAPIVVTGVTLDITNQTLITNQTQQLTPTVSPSNAPNKNVTWLSNNTAVATVSSTGLVTAVAPGNAIITVTTVDQNKTATCNVTVNAPVAVTGVTLDITSKTLEKGATQKLTATVLPSNANNKSVTWSSNNTSVATVDSSGLVTSIGVGSAIITVTTVDGSKTATSTITVVDTTPPIISNINVTSINDNSAKITFTTNESSTDVIDYGITTSYGNTVTNLVPTTSHSINLSNLVTDTIYNYKITTIDAYSNATSSTNYTFKTLLTAYEIEKSTDGTSFVLLDKINENVQIYDDVNVTVGVTYYYRIKLVTNGVDGPYSNIVSITVTGDIPKFGKHIISLNISKIMGVVPNKIMGIN